MNLDGLKGYVAEIFFRLGMPEAPARLSAAALVAADVEGMPAHGVKLVPAYVERILAGSVSTETDPKIVHDGGSALVVDAGNILGPLSSDWAIPMVSERARASTALPASPCATPRTSAPRATGHARLPRPASSASRCAAAGR